MWLQFGLLNPNKDSSWTYLGQSLAINPHTALLVPNDVDRTPSFACWQFWTLTQICAY